MSSILNSLIDATLSGARGLGIRIKDDQRALDPHDQRLGALHQALREGNFGVVRQLADDEKVGRQLLNTYHHGYTALGTLYRPNAPTSDSDESTPLDTITRRQLTRRVLNYGADPMLPVNDTGTLVLGLAVADRDAGLVERLLELGADPNLADASARGPTPLMIAARDGSFEIARTLLAGGADPEEQRRVIHPHLPSAYRTLPIHQPDATAPVTAADFAGSDPAMKNLLESVARGQDPNAIPSEAEESLRGRFHSAHSPAEEDTKEPLQP